MRSSLRQISIATLGLLFIGGSVFSAPRTKKVEAKKSESTQQASQTSVKKPAAKENANQVKDPVQTTTIQTETAPSVVQPSQPTTTPFVAPAATSGQAAAFNIDWFVIAAGGTSGSSTNYNLNGTVGQTSVGMGSSTNYNVNAGFWQDFSGPPGCCVGIRGNVNGDASVNPNILDLNFLINYIFRLSGDPGPCLEESNVNGDAAVNPNILDLNFLVNYIFRLGPLPGPCP